MPSGTSRGARPDPPRTADAVVIGGGALGTSICLRLARAGLRAALIERRGLASGCTGTTVALVNASSKAPAHYTAMNLRSARLYADLAADLGADIGFEDGGNMTVVAETEDEMAEVGRTARELGRVPGLVAEALDARQAREIVPALSPEIAGALYSPSDGCVNPFALTLAQAAAAQAAGAQIVAGTEVTAVLASGGAVRGVATDRGDVHAPVVVIAAGIHTPALAETAGAWVPVAAKRGQIVTTGPLAPTLPIPVGGLRQVAWGSVIIGSTYEDAGYTRATEVPTMAALTGRALRLIPSLGEARAVRFWAGLRPWPADGLSIVGRLAGIDGLYVAATHSGITLAPLIGIALAELITGGEARVFDISPYSPARFDPARGAGADFGRFWAENGRELSRV